MDQTEHNTEPAAPHSDFTADVRRQALWAGVAGCVMLIYAFGAQFVEPILATTIFQYTLQIGGGSLVASALLLLSGARSALLFDGVAAMAIGAALGVSGLLLLAEGQPGLMQGVLNLIFAYLFISSGRRSMQDHARLGLCINPSGRAGRMADDHSETPN